MTPKGGGNDFRGIGLMEVLWKAISGIINRRLSSSIQFHDALHGFCAGRVTGTATLEENLHHQLIVMRDTIVHVILLYLRKAYNDLDRNCHHDILEGNGVVPRRLCILRMYWVRLQTMAKAGGH